MRYIADIWTANVSIVYSSIGLIVSIKIFMVNVSYNYIQCQRVQMNQSELMIDNPINNGSNIDFINCHLHYF